MVWYSHLLKNFPQFVVFHTVKGFSIVNEAEVDVFQEFSYFSRIQWMWQFDLYFLCKKAKWLSGEVLEIAEKRKEVKGKGEKERIARRVNKAEIDVFLELSYFFNDSMDVGNLISGFSAFSKTSLNIWKFMVHVLLKPGLEKFEHYFTSM